MHRLLTDADAPIAAFAADGTLIAAVPAAEVQLNGARTLAALGADALVAQVSAGGRAVGHSTAGALALDRIGSEPVLLATFVERDATEPVASVPPPVPAEPAERRHPLRFVWQIDAEDRFALDSEEFIALAGPATRAALGRTWEELTAALTLDPEAQVARALAARETWSGLTIAWPVDGGGAPLTVELSGLPVFDRERSFRGYRGFGVCRDVPRLNALAQTRAAAAAPALAEPTAQASAGDAERAVDVPLYAATEPTSLTPIERHAFQELARRLGRLTAPRPDTAASSESALNDLVAAAMADPGAETAGASQLFSDPDDEPTTARAIAAILDRFPIGVLVYRLNHLLYANRAFLRWSGYESLAALTDAGGLDALLIESGATAFEQGGEKPFALLTGAGQDRRGPSVHGAVGRRIRLRADCDASAAGRPHPRQPPVRTAAPSSPSCTPSSTPRPTASSCSTARCASPPPTAARRRCSAPTRSPASPSSTCSRPRASTSRSTPSTPCRRRAACPTTGREVIGRERAGGLIPLFMTIGRARRGHRQALRRLPRPHALEEGRPRS